jgi:threonine dehydrogenase-like Zn-dependent dehydrogenase
MTYKTTTPRPYAWGAATKATPLAFAQHGHGVQAAEENGRVYKIEFLGNIGRMTTCYRALALRKASRQVIATRDFETVAGAKAWLEGVRIPNVQAG